MEGEGYGRAHVATRTQAEEARRVLDECVLFRDLDPETRNVLFARVHVRSYAAGETIFLMGSAGDSLMAVVSGSVRISVPSHDGKEIVLAIIQPKEVFGEMALLDGKERAADAKAIGTCTLAVLERRDILAFLKDNPKVWPKLVEVLCARLRITSQHIAEIAFLELPMRLAKTLLRFASAEGGTTNRRMQVQLSQRELGNICGASRESINKCLGGWQRRGIVQIEEGVITVTDRIALEALANIAEA
jgi:CRP/FNR family transcriptional regulator, cyclic AMP receptor protein